MIDYADVRRYNGCMEDVVKLKRDVQHSGLSEIVLGHNSRVILKLHCGARLTLLGGQFLMPDHEVQFSSPCHPNFQFYVTSNVPHTAFCGREDCQDDFENTPGKARVKDEPGMPHSVDVDALETYFALYTDPISATFLAFDMATIIDSMYNSSEWREHNFKEVVKKFGRKGALVSG